MTLTRKIIRLVMALATLAILLTTALYAGREFSHGLTLINSTSREILRSDTLLPLMIYRQDEERIRAHLQEYFAMQPVRYVALFDPLGASLLELQRYPELPYALPDYRDLRGTTPIMEEVHALRGVPDWPARDSGMVNRFVSWLTAILGERCTDVLIPVFSPVSLVDDDFSMDSLIRALDARQGAHSLHVAGYVLVGISHPYIWQQAFPSILDFLLVRLVVMLVGLVVCWWYLRRMTGPLVQLAAMVDQVGHNGLDTPIQLQGGDAEARRIADAIRMVMQQAESQKTRLEVDQKLLALKVEERDSRLSAQEKELARATHEVSSTREDLHRMAYFDSLTGLPNRRLFMEQLNLLLRLAKRNKTLIALLFLDLDKFKRINDSLGHSIGDLLLREVGMRLSHCMRDSDLLSHFADTEGVRVSRLGGDEFTVVLNQLKSPESAGIVAARMLDSMSSPMMIDGHELVITPSIGIAVAPLDAQDVEGLIKAADIAMYYAKSAGRNNFVYYSEDMTTSNEERLRLETDLRNAITNGELLLHYQPQVDVGSGNIIGVEALIRWQHPEFGLIPPDKFIPMAEEMGLITGIGEWSLQEACQFVGKMVASDITPPRVAVNVSALAFSSSFVSRVKHILQQTGVDPASLELELTEGVLMESESASYQSMQEIKELGLGLSIDDFGTGYSSLSYLSHFPLDTLKIDRSFITDLDKSPSNASLVVAIIAMARGLQLRVIAEGVETSEQLEFMVDNGVDIIQGFLLSKPVPDVELVKLLAPGHFSPRIQAALEQRVLAATGK